MEGVEQKYWKGEKDFVLPSDLDSNRLNDYFVNIGKKISETFSNHNLSWNNPESIHTFVLKLISPGKTKHNLSLLSKESSLDILEFDSNLLQISAPDINISLNHLFNEILNCGCLPNDWKLARTTPVYKGKGDKNDIFKL